MKKKILWSSIIVLVFILAALFFVLSPKKARAPLCEPYLNISAVSKTLDTESCNCLKDDSQIKLCQDSFSDAFIYTDALKRMDLTRCESISKPEMKNACITIVKSKIDFDTKANNLSTPVTKQK